MKELDRYKTLYNKFDRPKKNRTITEIHDIYINASIRSEKMRKEVVDSIHEIVNEIPKINKAHITYFYIEETLYQYEMSFMRELDAYGTSTDMVNFREGSLEEIRDKKIHFLLNNTRAIELGQRHYVLSKKCKHYEYGIKRILLEMIQEELSKKFKEVKFFDIPKVIEVNLGKSDKRYIFSLSQESYGYYRKFDLMGELSDNIKL
jgi:hypothetical protein